MADVEMRSISANGVCAVVLAGGQATRMGNLDKGLQEYQGSPLAVWVAQRLALQTTGCPDYIAINANRNVAEYATYGYPVWADSAPQCMGPLEGFDTALTNAKAFALTSQHVLTVPCDTPEFPSSLLERLMQALDRSPAQVAFAVSVHQADDGTSVRRLQPTFCLMHISVHLRLHAYLQSGGRKVTEWLRLENAVEALFECKGQNADSFANANTLAELEAIAQRQRLLRQTN
ncbi:molybdenum cofactor guanylyltransferase MobA [Rhodoferax aquaticus]|uniref:Molybdenum cofactor guanylyltransferase n=1 Tax=Rhodoferax aquaticus TaxID=2527691 RepID=A0A515EQD9_9BURK|nr:molybdenum cofactor guanylyltransferase MobA [Rhodoferax aquaticus]QDL54866.1 molybdenum cofactor guanylyltransferase [Rhodoferax aquaticus]